MPGRTRMIEPLSGTVARAFVIVRHGADDVPGFESLPPVASTNHVPPAPELCGSRPGSAEPS